MTSSLLFTKIMYAILCIIFIISIITLVSIILGQFMIDVTNYTIYSEKIPSSFDGYKILQISDLHNTSFGKDNTILLKKIEKSNPDIIVMTGDMVNSNSKSYDNFYSLSKKIVEKYPTYYIMGNHELRLGAEKQSEIIKELSSIGITILDNKSKLITKDDSHIALYGLDQPIPAYKNTLKKNSNSFIFSLSDMPKNFSTIDNNIFNILITHSPFDFEVFEEWGADLVLSGHIHGGIIRLPFIGGVLSPERKFFPKYDAGEFKINNSTMIVSRGLGNGTINLRIFNNPEICVIELKNTKL